MGSLSLFEFAIVAARLEANTCECCMNNCIMNKSATINYSLQTLSGQDWSRLTEQKRLFIKNIGMSVRTQTGLA